MKPPKQVRKAVKAFLGVRKRDVSKWPEIDRPLDYKDRLRNSKMNYGVETKGLNEKVAVKPRHNGSVHSQRSTSQYPTKTKDQYWEQSSQYSHETAASSLGYGSYGYNENPEGFYYPPDCGGIPLQVQGGYLQHNHEMYYPEAQGEFIPQNHEVLSLQAVHGQKLYGDISPVSYGDSDKAQKDTVKTYEEIPSTIEEDHQRCESLQVDQNKDPWDDHKASTSALEETAARKVRPEDVSSSATLKVVGDNDIDGRLLTCMNELDKLTDQLETVVNLSEKMEGKTRAKQPDEFHQYHHQHDLKKMNEPISEPYCNLPPKRVVEDQLLDNYHRGIIKNEPQEDDQSNFPSRLPSRTPVNRKKKKSTKIAKRVHQLQDDNCSSSGYSSGSFESVQSYHNNPYDLYGVYGGVQHHHYHQQQQHMNQQQAIPVYDSYCHENPYEYDAYEDGWYYPASVEDEYYYQQQQQQQQQQQHQHIQHYDAWFNPYELDQQKLGEYSGMYSATSEDPSWNHSRTVSMDSSGKRKTVRWSKTVHEKSDQKETTAAMKGSPEEERKVKNPPKKHQFPEGHIKNSCMCQDCILARESLQEEYESQQPYSIYYA